jgi:hypothetical protein
MKGSIDTSRFVADWRSSWFTQLFTPLTAGEFPGFTGPWFDFRPVFRQLSRSMSHQCAAADVHRLAAPRLDGHRRGVALPAPSARRGRRQRTLLLCYHRPEDSTARCGGHDSRCAHSADDGRVLQALGVAPHAHAADRKPRTVLLGATRFIDRWIYWSVAAQIIFWSTSYWCDKGMWWSAQPGSHAWWRRHA